MFLFQAVQKAKSLVGFTGKVEIEARNETEALEAALGGADIVMLDNFSADVSLNFICFTLGKLCFTYLPTYLKRMSNIST